MKPFVASGLDTHSGDLITENLAALRAGFPELVTEKTTEVLTA
jgi:hypothetical protein